MGRVPQLPDVVLAAAVVLVPAPPEVALDALDDELELPQAASANPLTAARASTAT